MSISLGLKRTAELLKNLNDPQQNFEVIHVAGTNGKGSTCAFLSSILARSKISVGSFNSPHLLTERDAIRIDTNVIESAFYNDCRRLVEEVNTKFHLGATNFELITATAFVCFSQAKVKIAVIEVGLGGTLDATNVIPPPLISIITKMGIDHTEFLGNTIQDIASHKAGIIKSGCRAVVIAPQSEKECIPVFEEVSNKNQVPFYHVQKATRVPESDEILVDFKTKKLAVKLGLQGDFQLENVATVVKALTLLNDFGLGYKISNESLKEGIRQATIPGRLEWKDTPFGKVLVDGAHNLQGCMMMKEYVNNSIRQKQPIAWIIGFSNGKKASKLIAVLIEKEDIVYPVGFSSPPGMPWISAYDPNALMKLCPQHVDCQGSLEIALKSIDRSKTPTVIVCGSLYLVAELYRLIEK